MNSKGITLLANANKIIFMRSFQRKFANFFTLTNLILMHNMRQLKITKSITNRENLSLEKYFQEISKVDLITAEQEVELAKRIRQGDQQALDTLIKANLRFVVSVAKQYQNKYLSLNDLIDEGNLGLVKAAQKFDETRGFKFISYAVWWIRQSIMQALAEQSRIVRLPLNKVGSLTKMHRISAELEQKYERDPTPEELAEALESAPQDVLATLNIAPRHTSIDAPFSAGEDSCLLDVLADKENKDTDTEVEYSFSLSVETERVLQTLSPREREVIKKFFGVGYENPMSLEKIGKTMDLTRERIRQIKDKAILRLKTEPKSKLLAGYLG